MKVFVTAGGQGTKIWPYSREQKPKQFQPIVGESSSYQETINTLLKKFDPEDIYISTKQRFVGYVAEQSPEIPLRNYVVEPDIAKDRGPGEGLVFLRLSIEHPDEPFFLVQADVLREPEEGFLQMIDEAEELVKKHKKLVTGGIKITQPTMGIDYLELDGQIEGSRAAFRIKSFLPRKDSVAETAELIKDSHVVTHSNHTCWYPELMLEAYKKYRPDWYDALMKIKDAMGKPHEFTTIESIYSQMEAGPTEEVTNNVMDAGEAIVVQLPYDWRDLGTWRSVHEFFAAAGETYTDGKVVSVDTEGSFIKTSQHDRLIAVAGVKDLVIIDTDDALLVIGRDELGKIKDIQRILTEQEDTRYL